MSMKIYNTQNYIVLEATMSERVRIFYNQVYLFEVNQKNLLFKDANGKSLQLKYNKLFIDMKID
jgi:hypothetical protein